MFFIVQFPPVFVIFSFGKFCNSIGSPVVIHITQKSDLTFTTFIKTGNIPGPFATYAYTCNKQFIAGCNIPPAQYMPGNDHKTGSGQCPVFQELTPGSAFFI